MTRATTRVAILLLGASCSGSEGPEDTTDGVEPSPYIVDRPDDDGGDAASLNQIADAVQAGLDVVMDLDPRPVHAAYDRVMAASEGTCPYEYVTPDGNYWFDSCETAGGASYSGYVFDYLLEGYPDPYGSGMLIDQWAAFGGAVANDTQGNVLEISGSIVEYHQYGDSGGSMTHIWYVDLSGTFRWDGPEADGTWLDGANYDPDLVYQRTSSAGVDEGGVYLSGGFSGLPDGWSIAFDENQVGPAVFGYPCAQELSGTVSVRSPEGTWYDVRFDAPLYAAVDDGSCDGCGAAFADGVELGQVCVSVDTLLQKAARP